MCASRLTRGLFRARVTSLELVGLSVAVAVATAPSRANFLALTARLVTSDARELLIVFIFVAVAG
jgi:hypothetical protein